MREIRCLNCKYVEITENGCKGFIGESIIGCRICNEINSEMEDCEDYERKIERGKRVDIKPIDEASWYSVTNKYEDDEFLHIPEEHKKYAEFIKDIRKHPSKLYELSTGKKLPLWKRIWVNGRCHK